MVVKTRRAYSVEKVVESIHPANSRLHQEHPLYEFSLHPWGEAMLWCVEEKTLLYVIRLDAPKLEHLGSLSATPRKVEEVLSPPLYEAIKERLPKRTFLWSVGRLDRLGLLQTMLPLVPGGNSYLTAIKDVKTFAVSLEPVEGLTLAGHFQMTDAKAAAKFKTLLEGVKIEGAKSQKVELPPAQEKEQWVIGQVRADVALLREWLNQEKK
jgi:hypothetical protein